MPYGTRAPKEIQHHLSALVLCRPSVSATSPVEGGCGDRGCVTGDHLPIRGLAVPGRVRPGPGDPDGVCVLRPSSEPEL